MISASKEKKKRYQKDIQRNNSSLQNEEDLKLKLTEEKHCLEKQLKESLDRHRNEVEARDTKQKKLDSTITSLQNDMDTAEENFNKLTRENKKLDVDVKHANAKKSTSQH